jgi:hypothetical protein
MATKKNAPVREASAMCCYIVLPREAYERLVRAPWADVVAEAAREGFKTAIGTRNERPNDLHLGAGEALVYEGAQNVLYLASQRW